MAFRAALTRILTRGFMSIRTHRLPLPKLSRPTPIFRFFTTTPQPHIDEHRYLEALKENLRLYPNDFELLANSHGELARFYGEQNKLSLVLKHTEQQYKLLQKVAPLPAPAVLETGRLLVELNYAEYKFEECEVVASNCVNIAKQNYPATSLEIARANFMLAHLKEVQGKYPEAEQLCLAAAEVVRQHKEPEFLANIYQSLANLNKNMQKLQEAETYINTCLTLLQESTSPGKEDMLVSAYSVYGEILSFQGKFKEAEEYHLRALKSRESANPPNQAEVSTCLNNLGMLYLNTGRLDEAERLFKQKMEIDRTLFTEIHPSTANSYHNLAAVDEAKGDWKSAKANFLKALEIRNKTLNPNHPHIAVVHQNLVGICLGLRQLDEAEQHARLAADLGRKVYPLDHPFMGTALFDLGIVQDLRGELEEALKSHLRALEIRQKHYPPTHQLVGSSFLSLGQTYKKMNNTAQAEEYYTKGFEVMKTIIPEDHPDFATILNNLASVKFSTKQFAEAETMFRQSLAIRVKNYDNTHPTVATTRANLATVLLSSKKPAEAEVELRLCLQAVEAQPDPSGMTPKLVAQMLIAAMRQQGKTAEAADLSKKYSLETS